MFGRPVPPDGKEFGYQPFHSKLLSSKLPNIWPVPIDTPQTRRLWQQYVFERFQEGQPPVIKQPPSKLSGKPYGKKKKVHMGFMAYQDEDVDEFFKPVMQKTNPLSTLAPLHSPQRSRAWFDVSKTRVNAKKNGHCLKICWYPGLKMVDCWRTCLSTRRMLLKWPQNCMLLQNQGGVSNPEKNKACPVFNPFQTSI